MNSNKDNEEKVILEHHIQQELCTTRLPYRQGRKLTAVKVYSIANESQHLLIFGVPSLNLRAELKALCSKYGKVKVLRNTSEYPCEQFTENFIVSYERIQSARIAKRFLDTKNFYGGLLHVCYAPEHETVDETREKLLQRRHAVLTRIRINNDPALVEGNKDHKTAYDFAGKTMKDVYKERNNELAQKRKEIATRGSNVVEYLKDMSEKFQINKSENTEIKFNDGNMKLKRKRVEI